MGPTPTGPILLLVHRARARIRIQRILDAACTALIPASGLALVGTHVTLAGVGGGLAILVAAGALLVAAIAIAAARAIPDEDVAARLDLACGLADRLRTAIVFARSRPATDFMDAAIRDGARNAARADVVRATPFREPANARTAALCALAAAALACVNLSGLRHGEAPEPVEPVAIDDELDPSLAYPDDVGYPRDQVDELVAIAEDLQLAPLREYGEELNAMLAAFERGELTKEQLLERFSSAESRLATKLGDPANAALPADLRERLADVHEAVARLESPRGGGGDKARSTARTPPKGDRLLALARRPRAPAPGTLAPPSPPQPPGKPGSRRPPGTPGPGNVRPGPTGPGGPVVQTGPGTTGALGPGPDVGSVMTPGGRRPGALDGGREPGRGTAPLTLAPPAGPRGDGTSVVHATGKNDGATSTRTTIIAAASQGFAGSPYRDVFIRYRRTAEEVMYGEKLPSSYRYFVKRYFWSIRPETRQE